MIIRITGDGYGDYIVTFGGNWSVIRLAIDELKSRIPSSVRSYDPDTKEWTVTSRTALDRWIAWAKCHPHIEIEWDEPEPKKQAAPPPPAPTTRAGAFNALCLLECAPPELVKAAYKVLAFTNHPDRGGDLERMKTINIAYDTLARELGIGQ